MSDSAAVTDTISEPAPRFVSLPSAVDGFFGPEPPRSAPEHVVALSHEALAALHQLWDAQAAHRAARAEVERAAAIDAAADATAVAAGRELPARRAEAGARQALELAERRATAAETTYSERAREFYRAAFAARAGWRERQDAVVDELRDGARRQLAELRETFAALDRERWCSDALAKVETGLTARWWTGRAGRQEETAAAEVGRSAAAGGSAASVVGTVQNPRTENLLELVRRAIDVA